MYNEEYVVVVLNKKTVQLSLDDFFSMSDEEWESKYKIYTRKDGKYTNTRTYVTKNAEKIFGNLSVPALIKELHDFNEKHAALFEKERSELYHSFSIPKRSGGLRRIDAPKSELMDALRELKWIFEDGFGAMYHTSAFAYVKGRSTLDAVKRHQGNESKWFAKFDLHNFFGSTTQDFVIKMFRKIYPFSRVINDENGNKEFEKAISLAFLNGGLPQGTPISPLITNIMMIPIDYKLFNMLRKYDNRKFVYTRYADDFLISCKVDFSYKAIENEIIGVLKEFGAPFELNVKKTRYGSSAGSNWNLGVMLNKDNQITVGYKNKKRFAAMIYSYAMDKKNNKLWTLNDVQVLDGYRNYYSMVEKEYITKMIIKTSEKTGVDIMKEIRNDLKTL